ncbi:MAG: hypothetical protein JSR58_07365 [Verrucomicrobia bacterium]|nr:hypothetical protein [Verrucomicrobiota bacterium]
MKKIICTFLTVSLLSISLAHAGESLEDQKHNVEKLWNNGKKGTAAKDGAYTSISAAMIGTGLGLAGLIALLAALFSKGSSGGGGGGHAHHCH